MTATVPRPTRIRAASHRMLLVVLASIVALAVAITVALVMMSGDSTAPGTTPSVVPAPDWPVDPETLSDKEKCQMARVRVC